MPTRIIKPPKIVRTKRSGAPKQMIITCDDGKEYYINDLAVKLGFASGHGLYQRLRMIGYDHPGILRPPDRRRPFNRDIPADGGGNAEWKKLSGRDRSKNLNKFKTGTWEAQL